MRSQVTQDALEEFQERLRRRDEALQKPVDEHDQIDRRRIQFLTSLLTEINFIDTICNSHMSLAAYKDRIVDTMIAKHFDRVVTKP